MNNDATDVDGFAVAAATGQVALTQQYADATGTGVFNTVCCSQHPLTGDQRTAAKLTVRRRAGIPLHHRCHPRVFVVVDFGATDDTRRTVGFGGYLLDTGLLQVGLIDVAVSGLPVTGEQCCGGEARSGSFCER